MTLPSIRYFLLLLSLACVQTFAQELDAKKELIGVWNVESLEADGKKAPKEVIKLMRFTFKEKELVVRGNFGDDREESCEYKLEASEKPKQLIIQPPKEKESIRAIYRIVDGKLEVCFVKGSTDFPKDFKSSLESKQVLLKFKRKEEKTK